MVAGDTRADLGDGHVYQAHGRFRISAGELAIWSHPIITHGTLILRDQGSVYAYDIRAK